MGREPRGVRVEQNPNGVGRDIVYVAPRVAQRNIEAKEYEVKKCTEENLIIEKYHEKQEVLSVKSTNLDVEEKYEKLGEYKKSSPIGSKSPGSMRGQYTPSSPLSLRKHVKYHDEEDNWSITSSYPFRCRNVFTTATSVKSKVTVGVAPTFRSAGRAERRKELPLTRPKSPNFTRRRSCGDAAVTSNIEKGKVCGRVKRHSLGSIRAEMTTPKAKTQLISGRNSGMKVKERVNQEKETTKTSGAKIPEQRSNLDITVES
ncbi:Protein WVD2-like 1, partial [Cucurbita argyrosperma subsp. argyrosperma]